MGLDGIQNLMTGIVLFIVVISCGIFISGSFYSADSSIDSFNQIGSFNSSMNRAENITSSVNAMQDKIDSVSAADSSALGWLNVLVGSVFDGLKIIGGSLGFVKVVMEQAATTFGIPIFIIPLLALIITIIVIFAIWSAITKV